MKEADTQTVAINTVDNILHYNWNFYCTFVLLHGYCNGLHQSYSESTVDECRNDLSALGFTTDEIEFAISHANTPDDEEVVIEVGGTAYSGLGLPDEFTWQGNSYIPVWN